MTGDVLRTAVGRWIGRTWAPAIAAIARLREARMFHADGIVCAATFEPAGDDELARRLGRTVLARLSPALWRGDTNRPDVLGIALRFEEPAQDLLFATIASPFTMGLALLTTNPRDFLANTYYAVSPFSVPGGHAKLRLRPVGDAPEDGSRSDRLRGALARGTAAFALEIRGVLRRPWNPLGVVRLAREVAVDQAALRFDPFHTGAGIVPIGVVHGIRIGAYAASQRAR